MIRKGKVVSIAVSLAIIAAMIYGLIAGSKYEPSNIYAEYCTSVSVQAVVDIATPASYSTSIYVSPNLGSAANGQGVGVTHVHRGEVVEFRVASSKDGAISIHGLTELAIVRPGRPALLKLRTPFSGQFPLHFHSADGLHEEIWLLDVVDKATVPSLARRTMTQ